MESHTVPIVVYERGAIKVIAKYIQRRKNTYYFRRRIPDDIAGHYPNDKSVLFFSLKTKDLSEAVRLANTHVRQQDALWKAYRCSDKVVGSHERDAAVAYLESFDLKPGQHSEYEQAGEEPDDFLDELRFLSRNQDDLPSGYSRESSIGREDLPTHVALAADLFYGAKIVPTLSETLDLHRTLTGTDANEKSERGRSNAIRTLIDKTGDLPVDQFRRSHANEFVKQLLSTGVKTATVKRYLNYISPVFATGLKEYELNQQNVFHGLRIPGYGSDTTQRKPFTSDEIQQIQASCRRTDDRLRWAILVLSDTGLRVAEVIGLQKADLVIDGELPFVMVRPNEARSLKTEASQREVPLVGTALWAAKRLLEETSETYLFPNYISESANTASHASSTLNKWLRSQGYEKTTHSFRHSIRDRLRNVNTPEEVQDRIGGWSLKSVGQSYGQGHDLRILHDWMSKISFTKNDQPD